MNPKSKATAGGVRVDWWEVSQVSIHNLIDHQESYSGIERPAKGRKPNLRESKIEKYLRAEIAKLGGWCEKHTSPGTKGPPDNIVMWGAYISGNVVDLTWQPIEFIETKAPKKGPTVLQARDHARRRAMGFQVHVISSMEQAESYLKSRGKK